MSVPYKRIHEVINPAAGQDEPILNVINDVCHQYKVEWSVSVTHKFGDATDLARRAAEIGSLCQGAMQQPRTARELGRRATATAEATAE